MEGWWGEAEREEPGGFGVVLNVGSSSGRHLKRVNGVERERMDGPHLFPREEEVWERECVSGKKMVTHV